MILSMAAVESTYILSELVCLHIILFCWLQVSFLRYLLAVVMMRPRVLSSPHVFNDGDRDDDGDENEDDESIGRNKTVVEDLVYVGSKQCTSLLQSVVLIAPKGSSLCATVVGQQRDVLSVEQLSAMSRTDIVGTRDLFLQLV
jgi:hypothetical protein